jgi:hypothetical protein
LADHPQAMAELRRPARRGAEPLYSEAAHTIDTSGSEPS